MATHHFDDETDVLANHWQARKVEADKLMANLREALPNLVYADRDNHVLVGFEEPLYKMLRNEPLDQYQIAGMQLQGDYIGHLLSTDGYLKAQRGYRVGKEFR